MKEKLNIKFAMKEKFNIKFENCKSKIKNWTILS